MPCHLGDCWMTPRTHSRTDWDPPSQDTGWQAALDSSIGWLCAGGPLCSPRDSSHCNWLTKPPVDGGGRRPRGSDDSGPQASARATAERGLPPVRATQRTSLPRVPGSPTGLQPGLRGCLHSGSISALRHGCPTPFSYCPLPP